MCVVSCRLLGSHYGALCFSLALIHFLPSVFALVLRMISVIIPTYQEGKNLPETLDALFAQTMKNIEIIVVDDGSTDDTAQHVQPYLSRITYLKIPHSDRQIARNIGMKASRGEYVIVCDADTRMIPTGLSEMASVLDLRQDISFVYSSFRWGWKQFLSFDFDLERLKKMNYINMASLVRRSDHPGFDESLGRLQDWDIWLTLGLQGKEGYRIPRILFSVGEHRGGLSRWLPKIMYSVPWKKFGIRIARLENYAYWRSVLLKKHRLG